MAHCTAWNRQLPRLKSNETFSTPGGACVTNTRGQTILVFWCCKRHFLIELFMFLLLLLFQPNQMGSGYQNPPELLMLAFRLIKGKEPLRKENLGCSSSELFFARTTRKCCTFESHCCCSNCLGVESCISNLFCETTEGTAVCNYYSKNGHFIF